MTDDFPSIDKPEALRNLSAEQLLAVLLHEMRGHLVPLHGCCRIFMEQTLTEEQRAATLKIAMMNADELQRVFDTAWLESKRRLENEQMQGKRQTD